MKIKIDRDLCIGAGSCISLAPNTFEFDDKLRVSLKKSNKKDLDKDILAAAKSCPVTAITLEDENSKQIYP